MVEQVNLEIIGWRQNEKDSNVNGESKAYHLSSREPLKVFQHREWCHTNQGRVHFSWWWRECSSSEKTDVWEPVFFSCTEIPIRLAQRRPVHIFFPWICSITISVCAVKERWVYLREKGGSLRQTRMVAHWGFEHGWTCPNMALFMSFGG